MNSVLKRFFSGLAGLLDSFQVTPRLMQFNKRNFAFHFTTAVHEWTIWVELIDPQQYHQAGMEPPPVDELLLCSVSHGDAKDILVQGPLFAQTWKDIGAAIIDLDRNCDKKEGHLSEPPRSRFKVIK